MKFNLAIRIKDGALLKSDSADVDKSDIKAFEDMLSLGFDKINHVKIQQRGQSVFINPKMVLWVAIETEGEK